MSSSQSLADARQKLICWLRMQMRMEPIGLTNNGMSGQENTSPLLYINVTACVLP